MELCVIYILGVPCSSMELRSGAQSFMEDKFHLDREDGLGLAVLTHSREMKPYPVSERPPGLEAHSSPTIWRAGFPLVSLKHTVHCSPSSLLVPRRQRTAGHQPQCNHPEWMSSSDVAENWETQPQEALPKGLSEQLLLVI